MRTGLLHVTGRRPFPYGAGLLGAVMRRRNCGQQAARQRLLDDYCLNMYSQQWMVELGMDDSLPEKSGMVFERIPGGIDHVIAVLLETTPPDSPLNIFARKIPESIAGDREAQCLKDLADPQKRIRAKKEIWEGNQKGILSFANALLDKSRGLIDLMNLVQQINVRFSDAIDRFDLEKSGEVNRVMGVFNLSMRIAIHDILRNEVGCYFETHRSIDEFLKYLEACFDRGLDPSSPDIEELAVQLGVDVAKADMIAKDFLAWDLIAPLSVELIDHGPGLEQQIATARTNKLLKNPSKDLIFERSFWE